jgi:hypothetical protein
MVAPIDPTRDLDWIATQALTRVGAVSVDNPASAEDLALAQDRVDVVAQDLQARGICYVADLDSTPAGLAHQLANAVAISLLADFGDRSPPGQNPLPPLALVENNLRRISSDLISYGPQQVSYF